MYDISFLKSRGFQFYNDGDFQIADAGYFSLVYSEVESSTKLDEERKKISDRYAFSAIWLLVRETGAIQVIRPVGETRIFIFNPTWSRRTDYVNGKIKLLDDRFSPDAFDELFDVKAVHNHFYNELWGNRLDLASTLKKGHKFADKDAILIAQRILDRITFLYFCCESGIVTKVDGGNRSLTSGRDFFSLLRDQENIAKCLSEIFFDFYAKSHDKNLVLGKTAFDIPYLNGGLFVNESCSCEDGIVMDNSLNFSSYDFTKLFDLLNNYLWVIDERTPLRDMINGANGTLTPEILGHMYEKFVISLEQLDLSADIDINKIRGLLSTNEGNKKIGAYYTPEDVVQFILSKTIFPAAFTKMHDVPSTIPHDVYTFESFWNKNKDDEKLITQFVDVLLSLKIVDPAVGSGHFLLGAANEIYRMVKICNPNDNDYELRKRIITNCIYGVDIMPGAVEICKLRLWLWLMSSRTEPGMYPPLPNIEYRIRTGNSLIGLIRTDLESQHFGKSKMINPRTLQYELESFSNQAEKYKDTPDPTGATTSDLRKKYEKLKRIFDEAYSFDIGSLKEITPLVLKELAPFHWGINFYEIFKLEPRGFDILLGNPPWGNKVLKKEEKQILKYFKYENTTEIAASFFQREIALLKEGGFFAQILPDSIIPNSNMSGIRDLMLQNFEAVYLAYIGTRPGKIFDGVEKRVSLAFGQKKASKNQNSRILTTKALMFLNEERSTLFRNLEFRDTSGFYLGPRIGLKGDTDWLLPKIGTLDVEAILHRLKNLLESENWRTLGAVWMENRQGKYKHKLMFRKSGGYWLNALTEFPYETSKIISMYFPSETSRDFALLLFNSHLLYLFWAVYGNFHDFLPSLVEKIPFPLDEDLRAYQAQISSARLSLEEDLLKNFKGSTKPKERADGTKGRDGQFRTGMSKPLIDKFESLIGVVYGLSEEQVTYLCNYDSHIRRGIEDADVNDE